jgi:CRP-like cAMP-binding protein/GNAT superfamily N-acetyltransferase
MLDIGAHGDLIGEFGRLAVHPEARGKRVGHRLMEARLDAVKDRLHLGIVENRAVHPFSQRISDRHGFVSCGFLPSKLMFDKRENIALYVKHFGQCLALRRNHPRIIPEAWPLADHVLTRCGIPTDAVVDDATAPYHREEDFEIEEMSSEGYASLLHFERGRVRLREILGPVKLHSGFFQIRVSHYDYLLAKREGHLFGGIGYFFDEREQAARILELVSVDGSPVRFLLEMALQRFQESGEVHYVEVDVNAHTPSMQRTLLELGFLPAAYIPAMSFHRVERLDGIRMVRLFQPLAVDTVKLHAATQAVADHVIEAFGQRDVLPRIAEAVSGSALFQGLDEEQSRRLASIAMLVSLKEGQPVIEEGRDDHTAFLLLEGSARIILRGTGEVGVVATGEMVGELSLLGEASHHATACAREKVEAACFQRDAVLALIRRRPDIGVIVYRNLAEQLGKKLIALDRRIEERAGAGERLPSRESEGKADDTG